MLRMYVSYMYFSVLISIKVSEKARIEGIEAQGKKKTKGKKKERK